MVRRSRRGLVVVAVAALVSVQAPGQAATDDDEPTVDELRGDLADTERAIDAAADELDATRSEIVAVTAEVRESSAILAAYEADLALLRGQLAAAEEDARVASARTDRARSELAVVDDDLAWTEERLDDRQRRLHDRAVSAFMYGEPTLVDAVAGSRSTHDLVTTTYYLRSVLRGDADVVEEVDALRVDLVDARTQSDRLREVVELEQLAAEEARVRLEGLTADQETLTALAAAERERRAALLRRLEINEAATETQLAELEQESASLQEQLRDATWRAGAPGEGSWVWPASGSLTSPFGYRTHPIFGGRRLHAGVDIGAGSGQEIVAANTGLVVTASCSSGGYGCRTVVDHGGGWATLYAHQSSFAVAEGELVTAGQVIGFVGSTGASTGPHLHFEIRRDGVPTDPMLRY